MDKDAARLLRGLTVDVEVSHGLFLLADVGHAIPAGVAAEHLLGGLVATAPGGAAFSSAAPSHIATVTVEVWSSAPADATGWELTAEQEFTCESGQVQLRITDAGPTGGVVDLDGPGLYGLRVGCRGREGAGARAEEIELFSGVEQWRLQLWKVAALGREPTGLMEWVNRERRRQNSDGS